MAEAAVRKQTGEGEGRAKRSMKIPGHGGARHIAFDAQAALGNGTSSKEDVCIGARKTNIDSQTDKIILPMFRP